MTEQSASAPVLTPIRSGHEFDVDALKAFLAGQADGFEGAFEVLQFEGGQSNPTFQLRTEAGDYVLRKQPPGELLPSAHQVDREYRVMHALGQTDVPVPRMIALCEDNSIIGTKFYVMEKVEGRVFTDLLLAELPEDERSAVYLDLVSVLARLHGADHEAIGLGEFGRPGNYYPTDLALVTPVRGLEDRRSGRHGRAHEVAAGAHPGIGSELRGARRLSPRQRHAPSDRAPASWRYWTGSFPRSAIRSRT